MLLKRVNLLRTSMITNFGATSSIAASSEPFRRRPKKVDQFRSVLAYRYCCSKSSAPSRTAAPADRPLSLNLVIFEFQCKIIDRLANREELKREGSTKESAPHEFKFETSWLVQSFWLEFGRLELWSLSSGTVSMTTWTELQCVWIRHIPPLSLQMQKQTSSRIVSDGSEIVRGIGLFRIILESLFLRESLSRRSFNDLNWIAAFRSGTSNLVAFRFKSKPALLNLNLKLERNFEVLRKFPNEFSVD